MALEHSWRIPHSWPSLEPSEVHVWRASLRRPREQRERLSQYLSVDEKDRAARFRFDRDRDHFAVARGLLRSILGYQLQVSPETLVFACNSYGKPELDQKFRGRGLSFNVSHSHELALFALTAGRSVGVDIEYLRPGLVSQRIAEHSFSKAEIKALRALPAQLQVEGFFNCWTRKEAYVKCRGEGLSHPLDGFDVSLVPGEPVALLNSRIEPQELGRWWVAALMPGKEYAAALVVEGKRMEIKCWQVPE